MKGGALIFFCPVLAPAKGGKSGLEKFECIDSFTV
jgi:hypothetical protein